MLLTDISGRKWRRMGRLIGSSLFSFFTKTLFVGIGSRTTKRLNSLEIHSVSDLRQTPLSLLEQEFGPMMGPLLLKLAVGIDEAPVVTFGLPQVIIFQGKALIRDWDFLGIPNFLGLCQFVQEETF